MGRWISSDSQIGTDFRGLNLYNYAFNNPVMYSDFLGNWPSWGDLLAATATLALAALAVVATVATAGAAGAVIATAATYYGLGCAAATLGTITTTVAVGCAVTYGACAISDYGECLTGTNIIRDGLLCGNDKLYGQVEVISSIGCYASCAAAETGQGLSKSQSCGKKEKETSSNSAHNVSQYEKLKNEYAADEITNAERVGSALKNDPNHRAASYLTKEQLVSGKTYSYTAADSCSYTLLQTQGQLNGNSGIYEFILNSKGQVTHQFFIKGGTFTGFPNQKNP